ncbi:hypothetical protein ACROYT_G032944 [Oculina patagonica]
MKTLLFKKSVALVCLLLVDFCSSAEEFKVFRYTQSSKDSFLIPLSKCINDTVDYCSEYNAAKDTGRGCFCDCDDKHATFSFHKKSWSCLRNEDARTFFGCSNPTFFENENRTDKLTVLGNGDEREITLNNGGCIINATSSWYIDCRGEKVGNLQNNPELTGRVVNLGISCSSANKHYCLLFKLRGNTKCPLTAPQTTTATKVVEQVAKTAPPVVGISKNPTQVLTAPSPAADRKNDDVSVSLANLGLIVGVTVAVILVFLLAGVFIHRQLNARKHPRAFSERQSSQSESGSQQPSEQSDGYATLSTNRSSIYASNYAVPYAVSEVETGHLRPPGRFPASNNERHENKGLDEEEPFYNTVDELFPNGREIPGEYEDPVASETPHNIGPISVEQRVYNMIEVLNTDTSESPNDYESNEEYQEHPGISVAQPVYNMMEVLDAKTDEKPKDSDPRHKELPVHKILEEPLANGTGDTARSGPSSVKDPVYNVLDGPDTEKIDSPNDETLYTVKEGRDQDNRRTFLYKVGNLQNNPELTGRVVNLGISCSSANKHYCLLFKLRGVTKCPLTAPQTTTATKVVEQVAKTAPPVVDISKNPTQVLTAPSPAADRKNDDVSVSLANLGLIVGVTVSVILVFLLAGVFIHRQLNARKHPRAISERQSSQSDSGSQQPSEQSDGYATLSTYTYQTLLIEIQFEGGIGAIYASNYAVPYVVSEDETGHLRPPGRFPAINTERHENKGLDEEEPFYNTVDELFPNGSEIPGEYEDPVTSERPHNIGPISVEQRVYNMIEVLNTDTSESPNDYESNEEYQENAGISVEQPVYNMMEAFDAKTVEEANNDSDPRHNELPVYKEERLQNDTGDIERSGPSSVKDGPDTDKTDPPNDETLYNVKEGSDQDNRRTFLYKVA